MTSTYDHRIIQGAESGRFLAAIEALLQGESGFYERVFGDLGRGAARPRRRRPQPAGSRRRAGRRAARRPRRRRGRRGDAPGGAGRDLAGQGPPHPRPPRRPPRPARLRARGRPRARSRAARPDRRRSWPGSRPGSCACTCRARRSPRRCPTCARPTAAASPTRSSTSPRTASGCGCARRSSPGGSASRSPPTRAKALLKRLTEVDALERFMHKAYLGQKQFSVEGLDMTVPMLDELIQLAAGTGTREVVLGMAHRGRLNVLAHNLGRPVRHDLRRVRGRLDARADHHDPAGRHRRREVPPRRQRLLPAAGRRVDHRPAGVQPLAPGVRRAGRGRRHPRGADHAPGPARPPRPQRGAPGHPPRRRGVPRARASSPRRSTSRRSTATRSAAPST